MSTPGIERFEIEFGDPPVAKLGRRPRWTVGRLTIDIPIIIFVSSSTLSLLFPTVPLMCGHTPERDTTMISGLMLLPSFAWSLLKD